MPSILISGASSGLGCGVAVALAERGWDVFAGVRGQEGCALGAEVAALSRDVADRIQIVQLDVTVPSEILGAADRVVRALDGPPDVLWCNAGWASPAFFEELDDETCRSMVETMFFGTLSLVRCFLPLMRARGGGRIAVTSSNAANAPHPMFSVYAAAKWALEGWAEALQLELRPFGLDVVVLQPGNHATSFAANLRPPHRLIEAYQPLRRVSSERLAALGARARPPRLAVDEIVASLERTKAPLRVRIGLDAKGFAALRHLTPFWVRQRAVDWVTGFDQVSIPRPTERREGDLNPTHERHVR